MARYRRTKAEVERIRTAIHTTVAAQQPMTVRQVFYVLTVQGVIDKTEAEYKRTVARLLQEMRRSGELPYVWIADATRWQRKPATFDSPADAMRDWANSYRRALWKDSPVVPELWLEGRLGRCGGRRHRRVRRAADGDEGLSLDVVHPRRC
jgi:hypothetical protein